MSMDTPAIEVDRFSFAINGQEILHDLSFSVNEGERVSIIGPNGAGKTTLLKCMVRIHTGGRGEIRIAGKPLGAFSQKDLARHVGYVPQADANIHPFSVVEFVTMGRYPHLTPFTLPDSRDRDAISRALDVTGTTGFIRRRLSTLSGGERQRVFIAAALAQEAGILLLDEPATFLDPLHASEIHRLLDRINGEGGVTMLSVTHDINIAALTSHRVLALKNGRMAFWGTPEGLMNEAVLREIYGTSFLFVTHPRTGRAVVLSDVP
jgi:iron complex transport system ATP-binding protein